MTAAADPDVAAPMTEAESPRRRGGGPRTPEGKKCSSKNAFKHGLCARTLLPDDLAGRYELRKAEMIAEYRPETPYQESLLSDAARASVQLERCWELEVADRGRVVERTETSWDADRRLEVEALGARLADDPGRVAEALGATFHGADWLSRRWRGLAEAAEANGRWDEAQRTLAFDLLGTPAALRPTSSELPPDGATAADLVALADRWIAALEESRATTLERLDDSERTLVLAGMPGKEDTVTRRLQRYEAACRRALTWALAEFRRLKPEPIAPARPSSRPAPKSEPARPSPRPAPTFEPRPTASGGPALSALIAQLLGAPPARPEAPAESAPATPVPPASESAPAPERTLGRRARREKEKRERLAARRAARVAAAC